MSVKYVRICKYMFADVCMFLCVCVSVCLICVVCVYAVCISAIPRVAENPTDSRNRHDLFI